MVCGGASGAPRFERRETLCLYGRRLRKIEAHSKQLARENCAVRYARWSEVRLDRGASRDFDRRGGGLRDEVAEQEVCAVETVAGFFRHVPAPRTERFRDSARVRLPANLARFRCNVESKD